MPNIYPKYTSFSNPPRTICQEMNEAVFSAPFFNDFSYEDIINRHQTFSLEEIKPNNQEELLELKGFIFTVSHCGSTLLSRMLDQIQSVRVLKESEAINGLLLSKRVFGLGEEAVLNHLKTIVSSYSQKAGAKRYLIIKLTSWNVFEIKLIQKAYPGLKWIFLDRDEEPLMNSLLKADGGFIDWWYHPVDIIRKHFLPKNTKIEHKADYLRALIHGHKTASNNADRSNCLALKYPDFLSQYEAVLKHFGLTASPEELRASKDMLQYDAKSRVQKKWKTT